MPSKKKRKLEVEDGSPDIPVLRALREELSLPYLPELFYPNEGDDEDPMKGRETRESATSSAPDSWTSVDFREIDGVKRVVGLSLDNRLLKQVPMTHLKKLDALESLYGSKGKVLGDVTVITVDLAWKRIKKRSGVDCRFHDLRHTHLSLLLTNAESVTSVAQRAGNKTAHTTLTTYAHAIAGEQKAMVERMDENYLRAAKSS